MGGGNIEEYEVIENDGQYPDKELPSPIHHDEDLDDEMNVDSFEDRELEDLLEDERQYQQSETVQEECQDQNVNNNDYDDREDEYLENCGYQEPEVNQEVHDLVDGPEELALQRNDRSRRPSEWLNPSRGRSYAQVVVQKKVARPRTQVKKVRCVPFVGVI